MNVNVNMRASTAAAGHRTLPSPGCMSTSSRRSASQRTTCSRSQPRTRPCAVVHAAPSDVFVLDFDGVIVDSEPEVTASALEAAALRWPELFTPEAITPEVRQQLLVGMRAVRPVLVRGFESMVMLRMLLTDPTCTKIQNLILSRWPAVLEEHLDQWREDEAEMNFVFERVRNDWMTQRPQSWMRLQQPYEGVVDALNGSPYPFYIASSKAAHRVSALAAEVLKWDMPPDSPRLFASLLPPEEKKAEALRLIAGRPVCSSPSTTLHFVDDRLDTLLAVRAHADLDRWRLYLADWGYNTEAERREAAKVPGVTVIGLQEFCELVKFGLLMRVDDGCEPTPEEVAAGVSSDE